MIGSAEPHVRRPTCDACLRPRVRCVCASLPRADNRTPVVIVQHPRERLHPFGTAPLCQLGLARCELAIAWTPEHARRAVDAAGPRPWMLFPGPTAVPLEVALAEGPPTGIVAVDGTWHTARSLVRTSPALASPQRVRLEPGAPSRYRIRREPAPECLSTLEALIAALRWLEPETMGFDALLGAFDAMVERQLGLLATRFGETERRRARARPDRVIPPALREAYDRCVVVYVECSSPQAGATQPLYVVANRPATGASWARFVQAPPPKTRHLEHLGFGADALLGGLPQAVVAAELREFLGPDGLVAAWHPTTLEVLRQLLGVAPADWLAESVLLKGVYCNSTGHRAGPLEEAVARESLVPHPTPFLGRAAQRMGNALAMVEWLRSRPRTG